MEWNDADIAQAASDYQAKVDGGTKTTSDDLHEQEFQATEQDTIRTEFDGRVRRATAISDFFKDTSGPSDDEPIKDGATSELRTAPESQREAKSKASEYSRFTLALTRTRMLCPECGEVKAAVDWLSLSKRFKLECGHQRPLELKPVAEAGTV